MYRSHVSPYTALRRHRCGYGYTVWLSGFIFIFYHLCSFPLLRHFMIQTSSDVRVKRLYKHKISNPLASCSLHARRLEQCASPAVSVQGAATSSTALQAALPITTPAFKHTVSTPSFYLLPLTSTRVTPDSSGRLRLRVADQCILPGPPPRRRLVSLLRLRTPSCSSFL
jgi:hypothetical protein